MKHISCTIQRLHADSEDCWILSVPVDAAKNAAAEITGLLSGRRNRVVFSDRKTDFILTIDSVTLNGRRVSITKDWLECIEKLFSSPCRPGHSHIDEDFSDKHSDVCITVFVV